MDAIYRNDRTSAATHGGREPGHSEATDDTDYSNVLGGPTAHPLRNSGSAVRIHIARPHSSMVGQQRRGLAKVRLNFLGELADDLLIVQPTQTTPGALTRA